MVHVIHNITRFQILERNKGARLTDFWPSDGDSPAGAEDFRLGEIGLFQRRKMKAGGESPLQDVDASGEGRPVVHTGTQVVLAKHLAQTLRLSRPPGHKGDGMPLSTPQSEVTHQGGEAPLVRSDRSGLKNERCGFLSWCRCKRQKVDPGS